jgi:hypothetical protein
MNPHRSGVLDRCTLADLAHDGPALADVFFFRPAASSAPDARLRR